MLFTHEGKSENDVKNNMIIYKIKDNYSRIVLKEKIENGVDEDLYFYSLTNNLNNCKLISVDSNKIYFQEIAFNIEKTPNFRIDHIISDFQEEISENEEENVLSDNFEEEKESEN